jgi:hypothetical protein
MPLTRIVKGMLASGAVTGPNLTTTDNYTVTNIATFGITGRNGLEISGLGQSTSSYVLYYNNLTNKVTFGVVPDGGGGGGTNPFNQVLNTFNSVSFADLRINNTRIQLGQNAGSLPFPGSQGSNHTIAIGTQAAEAVGYTGTVAIGYQAGLGFQFTKNISIGWQAGLGGGGEDSVYIGRNAGSQNGFGDNGCIAIGPDAGNRPFGTGSIAIGANAGNRQQADGAIAIGNQAAPYGQGSNAIAIGSGAGHTNTPNVFQPASSIAINGLGYLTTSSRLVPTGAGFFVQPVRNSATNMVMYYNTATKEITYSSASSLSGSLIPGLNFTYDVGSPTNRWRNGYFQSLFVSTSTIYFEDDTGANTSTLALISGAIKVDGTTLVDQSVATGSSPTFGTVNASLFNVDSFTAATATITNLTVIGTMTTLNVTTENVTTENIVTQNFADGTSQTTAWTGTVAYSNVTGVPTLPNQSLDTTSNVTFNSVRSTKTVSAGGYPLDAGGTATTFASTFSGALVVSNQGGGIAPTIYFRGYGQNRPTSGATTGANPGLLFDSSRGTHTAPTAVGSGDLLGGYFLGGHDGTRFASEQNIWSGQLGHTAAEAFAGTASTTTNAGTNFAISTQPPAIRLSATSKQRFFQQSWTAASGSNAPQLNLFMGSGVDGTAPSLVSADGTTTYTGYGRSNIFFHNSLMNIFGVPTQDSAPDNATLTATNVLNFVTGRRSGVAGRRNIVQSGDDLGIIGFRGQTANNGTGAGARGAVIFSQALETFSGTVNGAALGISTVNSGTNVEANRLFISDAVMRHNADSHLFRDKTGSFTGLTVSTSTVRISATSLTFPDNTTQTTAASAPGQTTVYARNALPAGVTGRIITISDSGSDSNAPAGNYAPAYWDPDANDWTYIGNSNSVTPI